MANERMMHYGKKDVFVYRTYAKPLTADPIPESNFTKRDNIIFGVDVQVALYGDFLHNYIEGDNTNLVATDSMKNFIQRQAGEFEYSTIDGFLAEIAKRFIAKYPQINQVVISGQEVPFGPVNVAKENGIEESGIVLRPSHTERARATVTVKRTGNGAEIVDYASGIQDIHLIKITGNSFYGYVQDEYTQLPEEKDRNLFIYVDIDWTYNDVSDGTSLDAVNHVPAEQVRDIAASVFHDLQNNSIQHLVYHIGLQILERFPQLNDVKFYTNNRTWLKVVENISDSEGKVYTEPPLPYGYQAFSVTREDLKEAKVNRKHKQSSVHV
ncbi:factor-independent urate hydroxylase [Lentibacillus sp. L22]